MGDPTPLYVYFHGLDIPDDPNANIVGSDPLHQTQICTFGTTDGFLKCHRNNHSDDQVDTDIRTFFTIFNDSDDADNGKKNTPTKRQQTNKRQVKKQKNVIRRLIM
jgi:hypothetical protein